MEMQFFKFGQVLLPDVSTITKDHEAGPLEHGKGMKRSPLGTTDEDCALNPLSTMSHF